MSSKTRRGGLGRGLGALIPTAHSSDTEATPPTPPTAGPTPPAATSAPPAAAGHEAFASPALDEQAASAPRTDSRSTPPGFESGAADRHDDRGNRDGSANAAAASDATANSTGTIAPTVPGSATETRPASGEVATADDSRDNADITAVPGATFAELPVGAIHANAQQPRQVFDEDALAELTHSVRAFGVLQPIVVRPDGDGYELVMGERRLRAVQAAGLDTIPAIVRTTADTAMLRDALLENIHRVQLNPLEEAAAYQQLLAEFDVTHDQLASRIGRSRPQISNTIRLLQLPVPVQRRVAAGVLSAGHARALLGLEDRDAQDELAMRIVAEGLSVRATEELVALSGRGQGLTRRPRASGTRRLTAPGVEELAERLSDLLDTRVRVDLGRRKGKITVEFASVDDLERIVGVIAPQLRQQSTSAASND